MGCRSLESFTQTSEVRVLMVSNFEISEFEKEEMKTLIKFSFSFCGKCAMKIRDYVNWGRLGVVIMVILVINVN